MNVIMPVWFILLLLVYCGHANIIGKLKVLLKISVIADSNCNTSPLQVISIFDITLSNLTQFREQQVNLIESLRHIDKVTKGRQIRHSLIAYHRQPVTLTYLNERSGLNKVSFNAYFYKK